MELLYFILGFAFASYLMPILEGLGAWFLTWVEAKKAKQSEIVNQANIKMRKDAASTDQDTPSVGKIGFQYLDAEEGEDEEDEV
jgi:hypothetical protein